MKVIEKSLWGIALSENEIMTTKKIKILKQIIDELQEDILGCCVTQGAVSENEKWYIIRKRLLLKKELEVTKEDLKEAIHEKLIK